MLVWAVCTLTLVLAKPNSRSGNYWIKPFPAPDFCYKPKCERSECHEGSREIGCNTPPCPPPGRVIAPPTQLTPEDAEFGIGCSAHSRNFASQKIPLRHLQAIQTRVCSSDRSILKLLQRPWQCVASPAARRGFVRSEELRRRLTLLGYVAGLV